MADVSTPLILRSDTAVAEPLPVKPSWQGRYKLEDAAARETRRRRFRDFVLDTHRTAGLKSEEALVRISAFIWHNMKAVILSGAYSIEPCTRTHTY